MHAIEKNILYTHTNTYTGLHAFINKQIHVMLIMHSKTMFYNQVITKSCSTIDSK